MTYKDRYDLSYNAYIVGTLLYELTGHRVEFGITYSKPDERGRQRVAIYDSHGLRDKVVTEYMQPAQLDRAMQAMRDTLVYFLNDKRETEEWERGHSNA